MSPADRKERLFALLPQLVDRLKLPGVKRIVLSGSLARGDSGSASDIDLLIVRDDPRRFLERIDDVYRAAAEPGVAVDALVYTRPPSWRRCDRGRSCAARSSMGGPSMKPEAAQEGLRCGPGA